MTYPDQLYAKLKPRKCGRGIEVAVEVPLCQKGAKITTGFLSAAAIGLKKNVIQCLFF